MRLDASKDYVARPGAPGGAAELSGHRLVGYSPNAQQPTPVGYWLNAQMQGSNRPTLLMNNYFAMMKAAAQGVGIAVLPDYLAVDHPELVVVSPEISSPSFTVYFAYPEELRRSRRVEAFRDFIAEEVDMFRRRMQ